MRVDVESSEDSNLVAHAKRELEIAGLFDKDSAYDGMIADCVMQLMAVLSSQGHSGGSADMTIGIFGAVSRYKPLTPITSSPDDWSQPVDDMWQCKRQGDLFSYDAGKTWYSVDDPRWSILWSPRAWLWRRHWNKTRDKFHDNLQKKAGA
jgi:hypothetical protein